MSELVDVGSAVRFRDWYSYYGHIFQNISTGTCSESLAAYIADHQQFVTPTCDLHVDCILEATSESLKAKMASAAIFLGILPSVLSMLGPSMTQLALLSARRPILSLLISVGSPGFYLERLCRLESPTQILSIVQGERFIPRLKSSRWGVVVGIAEYIFVAGSVLNVINLAVRVGDRTIMSFRCNTWFLPLIWVFSITFLFIVVAIPFQFSAIAKHIRNCTVEKIRMSVDAGRGSPEDAQWSPPSSRTEWRPSSTVNVGTVRQNSGLSISQFVIRELTPGMRHPAVRIHELPEFEPWVAFLFNVGYLLAAFHVLLGTCWFSSILFVSPIDAIGVIMRFFGSAAACRLVVMVELASMKSQELPQDEK
ncbi:uncharacterized protein CTRU02_213937 [Colletotrichum truncatum]|uniref:Uncharacterized protein n=1 Tax=Colletotrichum truncatum TaxID=5467 RepID=A0ACC3YJ50_COLTU|nr:uncharacterized protein CTRU02_06250 [Colletotrichum truncatum]KAF6792754.1 hypothetical protein CTRU02_06250 [Colletotrichum truncatum]